jgi:hypothetical protein
MPALSSSQNTVAAAIDNARALAMKENKLVMVVFRARWVNTETRRRQYIEAVMCEWTGDTYKHRSIPTIIIDRFEPIEDVPIRALAPEIQVACPQYGKNDDFIWTTQPHLPTIHRTTSLPSYGNDNTELQGSMIAVMFGGNGGVQVRNPQSAADRFFVDFNRDFYQQHQGGSYSHAATTLAPGATVVANNPVASSPDRNSPGFGYGRIDDEPYITFAPFLAIYDDEEARSVKLPTSDWSDNNDYEIDLAGRGGFISANAKRMHFNRYTGVALK